MSEDASPKGARLLSNMWYILYTTQYSSLTLYEGGREDCLIEMIVVREQEMLSYCDMCDIVCIHST